MAGSSLSGGMVVTMDDSRRVLSEGTVIVEEGRIADVVPGNIAHGERIDCRGKLILPGLVNAHVHALEGLWRGSGSNMRLIEWIRTRRYPLTAQLDDRGAAVSMRLACADMVRSGTTAFLEPEVGAGFLSAVAAAASQSGLRAGLAVSVGARGREALDDPVAGDSGGFRADDDAVQAARADAIDLRGPALGEAVEAWHGAADGRLSVWIGWHVLRRADRNIAQLIRRRADEHDLRITYHAAEFPGSVEMVMERTGLRPAEYADSVGLLGPGTVIGHGVHFEPEEFSILSRTGTTIAHCPAHRPKGAGLAPVASYLRAGVAVALGTDGGLTNDRHDILNEIRFAALLHRARNSDPETLTSEEILEMATRHGALGLGVGKGTLEPGQPADAAVFDLRRLTWPTQNVIDSIVHAADRRAVTTVVVGGEPLLHKGSIIGLDEDALVRDAEEIANETIRGAGLADEVGSPWLR